MCTVGTALAQQRLNRLLFLIPNALRLPSWDSITRYIPVYSYILIIYLHRTKLFFFCDFTKVFLHKLTTFGALIMGLLMQVKGQGIYAFVTLLEDVEYSNELRRALINSVRTQVMIQ